MSTSTDELVAARVEINNQINEFILNNRQIFANIVEAMGEEESWNFLPLAIKYQHTCEMIFKYRCKASKNNFRNCCFGEKIIYVPCLKMYVTYKLNDYKTLCENKNKPHIFEVVFNNCRRHLIFKYVGLSVSDIKNIADKYFNANVEVSGCLGCYYITVPTRVDDERERRSRYRNFKAHVRDLDLHLYANLHSVKSLSGTDKYSLIAPRD